MARRHCQSCADGGPPTEKGAVVGVLPLFGALLLGAGVALLVVVPRGNQPLASRTPQPAAIRPVGAPLPSPYPRWVLRQTHSCCSASWPRPTGSGPRAPNPWPTAATAMSTNAGPASHH